MLLVKTSVLNTLLLCPEKIGTILHLWLNLNVNDGLLSGTKSYASFQSQYSNTVHGGSPKCWEKLFGTSSINWKARGVL
jgi:endo-1,4-beta-mannosidase